MLPPTLREKRHYLAIEILSKNRLQFKEVKEALEIVIKEFLGYETAKAGMQTIELKHSGEKYGYSSMQGILSVDRKYVLKTKASLVLLKEINGIKASCRIKGVSGTIKKLREKFLK
ncbi:MAG: ribonuclease P protein component 2 [Nanoarchaeota archaeon]|nr:ribonuclease P protein component 2 [Nanoarchaeota archaeon]